MDAIRDVLVRDAHGRPSTRHRLVASSEWDDIRQWSDQIGKFGQHFFGSPEIQWRLQIGIIIFLTAHQYSPIYFVVRSQEMHVAGRGNRFAVNTADFANFAVQFLQLPHPGYFAVADEKLVVAAGLNFQVVIERGDPAQIVDGRTIEHGPVQFAGLTGGTQNESFAELHERRPGNPRRPMKIFDMRKRDQTI